jgi:hypothetical protein
MSALPYLVMAIVLQFAGHLADWLRSTSILTTTQVYLAYQDPGCDIEDVLSHPAHLSPWNTLCNKIQIIGWNVTFSWRIMDCCWKCFITCWLLPFPTTICPLLTAVLSSTHEAKQHLKQLCNNRCGNCSTAEHSSVKQCSCFWQRSSSLLQVLLPA